MPDLPAAELVLLEGEEVAHGRKSGRKHLSQARVQLRVDSRALDASIEAARAELESRGISFRADTLDTSVCYMAFFTDPDGNALMLHHRYAPRS